MINSLHNASRQNIHPLPLIYELDRYKEFSNSIKTVQELQNITDFTAKLLWYNNNVRSLALYDSDERIVVRSGAVEYKVFCCCNKCQTADLPGQKGIYNSERSKEIERIQKIINEHSGDYNAQIAFLFTIKGFHPDKSRIWIGEGCTRLNILDLQPNEIYKERNMSSAQQRIIWNRHLIAAWDSEYRNGPNFNEHWQGFNYEQEKLKLFERLSLCLPLAKSKLLKSVLNEIQTLYSENDTREIYRKPLNGRIAINITQGLKSLGYKETLFDRLFTNYIVKMDDITLSPEIYSIYQHIKETTKFYQCIIKYKTNALNNKGHLSHLNSIHNSKQSASNQIIKTYKWQGRESELPELFKSMIGRFIDDNTSLESFCNVFCEVDAQKTEPVRWRSNNATELLYFIKELMDAEFIKSENRINYERLKACFCKSDGSPFREEFKTLNQQIKNEITPKRDEILTIINQFK